jgi:AraC-like DNA-binding protein/mannose-6-phosphate isomerase-like protein (cupin superfamily)
MSRKRQPPRARAAPAPWVQVVEMRRPLVAHAARYADGERIPRHRHPVAQLIHAWQGVMSVRTDQGSWVVPPQRAVWVPPGVVHSIRMRGRVEMCTVYLEPRRVPDAPSGCCVVQVTPLLRELILRAAGFAPAAAETGPEARVAALLVDEIRAAPVAPLHLPEPRDPRLRAVTRALLRDPGDARSLSAWARQAGASARTLARGFLRETGMGFGVWRQQARLLRGLELLAEGEPVTGVALELGYAGPSAFIAMFRRSLGATPGRYFRPE